MINRKVCQNFLIMGVDKCHHCGGLKKFGIGEQPLDGGGGGSPPILDNPDCTLGSDVPLQLVGVKITNSCWPMLEVTRQASQTHYQSIAGEIWSHFYVNYIFLAQKLTKLNQFKEISQTLRNLSKCKMKIYKFFLFVLWDLLTSKSLLG